MNNEQNECKKYPHREYCKKWRERNRDAQSIYRKKYKASHPWHKTYVNVLKRCTDEKSISYKYYGGRGIKCLLSYADLKFLWERDSASLLKRPSLDRIDSKKNYTLSNCRYVELSENISMSKRR